MNVTNLPVGMCIVLPSSPIIRQDILSKKVKIDIKWFVNKDKEIIR